MTTDAEKELASVYAEIPFGLPVESLAGKEALGFRVPLYGFDKWYKLFTPHQLLAIGTFVKYTRTVREVIQKHGYSQEWMEVVNAYLTVGIDKLADYISALCIWNLAETINHVFTRFALPINWDYAELNPLSSSTGNYWACIEWVALALVHLLDASKLSVKPHIYQQSAIVEHHSDQFDIIVTDPPYYDAIPYSDLMDFFYVWLRRALSGLNDEMDTVFQHPLAPKWDHERNDGELIDDSSRFGGDKQRSKINYETGMFHAFQACYKALSLEGRLVIVFAHKHPDAWETLVSALISSGFVVDGSWPIMTERSGGVRNFNRASLSSSIWLVCKKRPENARPGWDNLVLEEMQKKP